MSPELRGIAHLALACDGGRVSEADCTSDNDGNKQVVKLKICSTAHGKAQALSGLHRICTES